MASFLKRTANASFVPRLLSDRSFYVAQWLAIPRKTVSRHCGVYRYLFSRQTVGVVLNGSIGVLTITLRAK